MLIVGGGIVGLWTAHELLRAGAKVTVIDRWLVGGPQAAAHGNTGWIGPSGVPPPTSPSALWRGLLPARGTRLNIRLQANAELLDWLRHAHASSTPQRSLESHRTLSAMKRRSATLYSEMCESDSRFGGWTQRGKLMLSTDRAGATSMLDASAVSLDLADVRRWCPTASARVTAGQYHPDDATVDPAVLLSDLTCRLRRSGVSVRSDTRPLRFVTRRQRVTAVTTTAGIFHPGHIVIAAGVWSAALLAALGVRLPLVAGRGYSMTVPRRLDAPTVPVLLVEARVAVTPFGAYLRCSGVLDIGGGRRRPRRRLRALRRAVDRYLPGLIDRGSAHTWSGLRPCSPDGLPYIGPCPGHPDITVACGHGSMGMALAPATGRLVSQLVGGMTPELSLAAVRPDRFHTVTNDVRRNKATP